MSGSAMATPTSVLGLQTGQHRLRRSLRLAYPTLGLTGLLATLALWAFAALRWSFVYSTYGPALVGRVAFPVILLSIATLATGLAGVAATIRLASLVVTTYEKGIVIRRGRRGKLIRWDLIRHVRTTAVRYGFSGLSWGRRASMTIVLDSGEKFRLTNALGDVKGLIAAVKGNVYQRLLEEYTLQFNSGQALSFGPLILSKEGIRKGRSQLAWKDLGRASLENGRLALAPASADRGTRIRIEARRIPNIDLCLQFIQHLSQSM